MNTTNQTTQTETYAQIILAHLMTGQTISTWYAIQHYHITCLAQRVSDLRADGIPIQGEMVSENGKRFKRYWLDADDIADLKASQMTTDGA